MFRIGEFARIIGVSIRTLRHYDALGLLCPSRLEDNGYRLYTAQDLGRMRQILALRELGFSLERIKVVLTGITEAQFIELLQAQHHELKTELQHLQSKLERLERRLKATSMYTPEIRSILARIVASAKGSVKDNKHVAALMHQLGELVCQWVDGHKVQRAGPDTVIWSGDYGEMSAFDLEFAIPIATELPETDKVRVYTLEATPEMGVVLHKGSYEQLDDAYAALAGWLEQNGYERVGNLREVYLHYDRDESKNLTEVHVPVRRKN